ncbi:MAG: glycosyltransferase [Bryobacterales bacterium]|nr:glycosyltransferase [Bryobacterales bacterium]
MDQRPLRVLVLSPRQCHPVTSGAKLREYYFLRALGEGGEVLLAAFADPNAEAPLTEDLPFCHHFRYVPKPPAYRPHQLLQGAFGKWPLPILNYTSAAMADAAEEICQRHPPDLIQLESIHMIRCASALSERGIKAPVVYNWHNIESELMFRYAETARSATRKLYASLTARKMRRVEADILHHAFGHLVCSERERQILLEIAPQARIAVVENGVDCDHFAPDAFDHEEAAEPAKTGAPASVVFVGSMDYFPNAEAAIWFAREIWPHLHQRLPNLRFFIVGARPPESVQALRDIPGVTVTGTVDSVKPYYRNALAAVVPLKTGGGTRLKILEAMAAGTPVVSTALGAEGLSLRPGEHYLLAGSDGPDEWVEHLQALSSTPEMRRAIAAQGLELVRSRYDWRHLGKMLVDRYETWLGRA